MEMSVEEAGEVMLHTGKLVMKAVEQYFQTNVAITLATRCLFWVLYSPV